MIRKEYEYRRNAIASMELARRAASPADKAHLLKLAEAWLDLATQTVWPTCPKDRGASPSQNKARGTPGSLTLPGTVTPTGIAGS